MIKCKKKQKHLLASLYFQCFYFQCFNQFFNHFFFINQKIKQSFFLISHIITKNKNEVGIVNIIIIETHINLKYNIIKQDMHIA